MHIIVCAHYFVCTLLCVHITLYAHYFVCTLLCVRIILYVVTKTVLLYARCASCLQQRVKTWCARLCAKLCAKRNVTAEPKTSCHSCIQTRCHHGVQNTVKRVVTSVCEIKTRCGRGLHLRRSWVTEGASVVNLAVMFLIHKLSVVSFAVLLFNTQT